MKIEYEYRECEQACREKIPCKITHVALGIVGAALFSVGMFLIFNNHVWTKAEPKDHRKIETVAGIFLTFFGSLFTAASVSLCCADLCTKKYYETID